MKKKMGVASMEDSRTRFRHESLIQDYEDLEKETGQMRKKLDAIKQKRLILMAEVRFLKKRCKLLTLNQKSGETLNSMIGRNPNSKRKKQACEESGLGPAVPRLHLKKKIRVYKEGIPHNRQQEEEAIRIAMPISDLNRKEEMMNGNGSNSFSSRLRIFDLNQISTEEEEELQENNEQEDDRKMDYYKPRNEELKNSELNLSICRNTKKGMNRAGKRKVSWQDPVALRV